MRASRCDRMLAIVNVEKVLLNGAIGLVKEFATCRLLQIRNLERSAPIVLQLRASLTTHTLALAVYNRRLPMSVSRRFNTAFTGRASSARLFPSVSHLQLGFFYDLRSSNRCRRNPGPFLLCQSKSPIWRWPSICLQHLDGSARIVNMKVRVLYEATLFECYQKPNANANDKKFYEYANRSRNNRIVYQATPFADQTHLFNGLDLATHDTSFVKIETLYEDYRRQENRERKSVRRGWCFCVTWVTSICMCVIYVIIALSAEEVSQTRAFNMTIVWPMCLSLVAMYFGEKVGEAD